MRCVLRWRTDYSFAMPNRGFAISLAAVLIGICALLYPLFLGQFYIGTDLGDLHVPTRVFYQEALREGNSFLWYPYSFNGYHVLAEGQSAFYHPLNLLSYRFLSFESALNFEMLRSYVMLLLGSFFFFRRMCVGVGPAMFGALSFTFCGFNILHYMHINLIVAAAHLPWLLLCIDVLLRESRKRYTVFATVGIVILTASSLLAGHAQGVWISILVQALYAAAVLRSQGRLVSRVAMRIIAAVALGFVCAAIQLIPLAEGALSSFRAEGPTLPEGFYGGFSVTPFGWTQLLVPYLTGRGSSVPWSVETDAYLGSFFPVLLVWLLLRWRDLGRWKFWAGFGCAILGLSCLLALGDSGGVYSLLRSVPLVGLFRAPGRYLLLTYFSASLLMTIAFADIVRMSPASSLPKRAGWLFLPAALSVILTAVVLSGGLGVPGGEIRLGWKIIAGPLSLLLAGLVVLFAVRGRPAALGAVVLLAVLDVGAYGLPYVWADRPTDLQALRVSAVESMGDEFGHIPETGRVLHADFSSEIIGVRKMTGYRALYRPIDVGLIGLVATAEESEEKKKLLNQILSVSEASPTYRHIGMEVPMSRVRLVSESIQSTGTYLEMDTVDAERVAIISAALSLESNPPGVARILRERPGSLLVETESIGEQLLVIAESYHEGWAARVEGVRKDVFGAYGGLAMAVLVGPGRQEVQLSFEPASVRAGRWLTCLGVAATLIWVLVDCRLGRSDKTRR